MKKSTISALSAILLAGAACAPTASAASPAQVTAAIQSGLAHLASTQQTSGCNSGVAAGCWNYDGYQAAPTGAAVFAFLNAKAYWPAGQTAAYNTIVANGITYLLAAATVNNVSTRDDGVNVCPGGGTCKGVYWYGEGEQTYSTGLVVGAIDSYGIAQGAGAVATTTGNLAGMTWGQIAQGITNDFAASQSSASDQGNYGQYGGWRYSIPGNGDSDTSTTQWAVYAFIFDAALGAQTPASTGTLLQHYLTSVQYPSGSGANTGGICYETVGTPDFCGIGPTNSDAGGWMLAETWLGMPASSAQVQLTLGWMNTNWKTLANNTWYGVINHPYAMLATYKGLETSLGITSTASITNLVDTTCGGNLAAGTSCNWYQDYVQWLVANQSPNGSWAGSGEWTDSISTSFDVAILGAAAIPTGTTAPPTTPIVSTLALMALGLVMLGIYRFRMSHKPSSAGLGGPLAG